jgi:hypothetical protein
VPLSDHEQRVLEQMERALAAEDPKFASSFHGARARAHARRRLLLACTGVLVGLAILFCSVVVPVISSRLPLQVVVGLIGFAMMLGSAYLAVTGMRPGIAGQPGQKNGKPGGGGRNGHGGHGPSTRPSAGGDAGFMGRFEQRWHRRRDGES